MTYLRVQHQTSLLHHSAVMHCLNDPNRDVLNRVTSTLPSGISSVVYRLWAATGNTQGIWEQVHKALSCTQTPILQHPIQDVKPQTLLCEGVCLSYYEVLSVTHSLLSHRARGEAGCQACVFNSHG